MTRALVLFRAVKSRHTRACKPRVLPMVAHERPIHFPACLVDNIIISHDPRPSPVIPPARSKEDL